MKNHRNRKCLYNCKAIYIMSIIFIVLVFSSHKKVQAETEDISLQQYHPMDKDDYFYDGIDTYFYDIYPNDNNLDYRKFMKYTYVISDDSVFGLKANTDPNGGYILVDDPTGKYDAIMPYNMSVYALSPGKATLKVYNGSKLVDTFNITVEADSIYSPSSYVDLTGDKARDNISYTDESSSEITKSDIKKENDLIKKYIKSAAQKATTNQRILAALNSVINHGSTQITEKKYKELEYLAMKKGITLTHKYQTAHSMLIEKKSLSRGYAIVNRAILNNLGFGCGISESLDYDYDFVCETGNSLELFKKYDDATYTADDLSTGYLDTFEFGTSTKLESTYDFNTEDPGPIYNKTHLPAWIIDKDTKQQVVSVGQTKELSASDMNNNIFSSDTSVVTAQNGKLTGVNPGIAIVYRFNDEYCDVFLVLVKSKGTVKTINSKIYTKTTKSYFTASEYAPYLKTGQYDERRLEDWLGLRLYELEPIFGKGSQLTTKYSKGQIKCYLNSNGKSSLIYTIGSGY